MLKRAKIWVRRVKKPTKIQWRRIVWRCVIAAAIAEDVNIFITKLLNVRNVVLRILRIKKFVKNAVQYLNRIRMQIKVSRKRTKPSIQMGEDHLHPF